MEAKSWGEDKSSEHSRFFLSQQPASFKMLLILVSKPTRLLWNFLTNLRGSGLIQNLAGHVQHYYIISILTTFHLLRQKTFFFYI